MDRAPQGWRRHSRHGHGARLAVSLIRTPWFVVACSFLASANLSVHAIAQDAPAAGRTEDDAAEVRELEKAREELTNLAAAALDPSNTLWSAFSRASQLRERGRFVAAEAWLATVSKFAARTPARDVFGLYVAGERMQICVHRGALDRAAVFLNEVVAHFDAVAKDDPNRDYAICSRALYEADYRLAVLDFDGTIEVCDRAERELAGRPIPREMTREFETRRLAALYALGRRDPRSNAKRASEALRAGLETEGLATGVRIRRAVELATLEFADSDPVAARSSLDLVKPLLDSKDGTAAAELRAWWLAVRIRLARFEGDRREIVALRDSIRDAFAIAKGARLAATVDASSDPAGFLHFAEIQEPLFEWLSAELATRTEEEAFEQALAATRSDAFSSSADSASDLPDLRERVIGANGVLLVYLPSPEGTHLFAVDATRVAHFALPAVTTLKAFRDDLDPYLDRRLSAEERLRFSRAAEAAGAMFFPMELRQFLANRTSIAISALGQLHSVPFELLRVDGVVLGARRAVFRVPSSFRASRDSHDAQSNPCVIDSQERIRLVAATRLTNSQRMTFPGLPDLPLEAEEILAIGSALPDGAFKVFLGDDADFAALCTPDSTRVLEILAHGVSDPSGLGSQAIVLAPSRSPSSASRDGDGLLRYEDITRLRAPPLVVLASCNAGNGPFRAGNEHILDLTGAFLQHGASCVVLATRRIETASAASMLAAIDRRLVLGDAPAEALRAAREELLGRSEFVDPVDQGFVVIGDGLRPVFARPPAPSNPHGTRIATAIAVIVVAMVGVIVRARRRAASRT